MGRKGVWGVTVFWMFAYYAGGLERELCMGREWIDWVSAWIMGREMETPFEGLKCSRMSDSTPVS